METNKTNPLIWKSIPTDIFLIDSIFLKTTMYHLIISLYTAALWWYYLIYFIHVEAESAGLLTPIFT